jgi:hypothetical protein
VAKRYWVGGSGSWIAGDTSKWSATSGGSGGASVPTIADDVIFDANSGTSPIVTVVGANACASITGYTSIVLSGFSSPVVQVAGSAFLNFFSINTTIRWVFTGSGAAFLNTYGKNIGRVTVDAGLGSLTLQNALVIIFSETLYITSGSFFANGYNVTCGSVFGSGVLPRTIGIGSGTWFLTFSSWSCSNATNLTVTGTGTISLTGGSTKSFNGGGIQTYPTLNQGGTGGLRVTGSNKFVNMTNTQFGTVWFDGGATNEFTGTFSLIGRSFRTVFLASWSTTEATILKKPSPWLMGNSSINAGGNVGLTFGETDGTMNYLSVSRVIGVEVPFWQNVNNTQTTEWEQIGTTQSTSWEQIGTTQSPGWQQVAS